MSDKPLRELVDDYDTALKNYGLACVTRLHMLSCITSLIRTHELRGKDRLDREIIAEAYREMSDRLYRGEIRKGNGRMVLRSLERFVHFIDTGEIKVSANPKGSLIILLPQFQALVDAFLSSGDFRPNTRNDMRWVAHKYFEWLAEQGFKSLRGVGAVQIQKFMLYCSETMAMGSVYNVRLFLAKLYAYLYAAGKSESAYSALLAFKVNRRTKTRLAHKSGEIAALLETIDRRTVAGKRAYAVMLLGIVLGLRACDVINLRLSDVDWVNGEIKILQAKTAESVVMPLTTDVGEALSDYILNARPNVETDNVFICLLPPYKSVKSAVTVGEIYRDCCKAAGLPANKRFHNLRRSRGTSLLESGSPVTMVAQVLGQTDVDSTKKYIAVDTEHLKLCALSFDGIRPMMEARE